MRENDQDIMGDIVMEGIQGEEELERERMPRRERTTVRIPVIKNRMSRRMSTT